MGGTYRSVRLLVCGSPVTGRYRQKSTVGDQLREKKGRRRRIIRRGKEDKRRRGEEEPILHMMSSPARHRRPRLRALFLPREEMECLPVRGERSPWR
ncbi:hypothetical protein BHM03_00016097 [Ensete ventricosum]|nr:hypothetical protein BHM03_00016097 [Ensete ventricosum]